MFHLSKSSTIPIGRIVNQIRANCSTITTTTTTTITTTTPTRVLSNHSQPSLLSQSTRHHSSSSHSHSHCQQQLIWASSSQRLSRASHAQNVQSGQNGQNGLITQQSKHSNNQIQTSHRQPFSTEQSPPSATTPAPAPAPGAPTSASASAPTPVQSQSVQATATKKALEQSTVAETAPVSTTQASSTPITPITSPSPTTAPASTQAQTQAQAQAATQAFTAATTPTPPAPSLTPPLPLSRFGRLKRSFKRFLFSLPFLFLAGDLISNPARYASMVRFIWQQYFVPKSDFEQLYTYANNSKHAFELTFKLDPNNLFHNISIYQLLILKDAHTVNHLLTDFMTLLHRIEERYDRPDEESQRQWKRGSIVLLEIRNTLARNAARAEYNAMVNADPEAPAHQDLDQEQYHAKYKPLLHTLEKSWCEVVASKECLEMLLPQLETFASELLLIQARNNDAYGSPEYLRQVAMNPEALPPVRLVSDLPYNQWQATATVYDQNLKELYKTFITELNMAQVSEQNAKKLTQGYSYTPDELNALAERISPSGPDSPWMMQDGTIGKKADDPAFQQGQGSKQPLPQQALQRPLTPQQLAKRDSLLRTSKRLAWRSLSERELEHKFRKFQEDRHSLEKEQLLALKTNTEYVKERKLRRTRQIEERYAVILRQERVRQAVARANASASLPHLTDSSSVSDDSPLKEYTKQGDMGYEDEVAALKSQMTTAELDAFHQKHPETSHIKAKSSRTLKEELHDGVKMGKENAV